MHTASLLPALPILASHGARILQSNDDGGAELYIRSFNDALNKAGHDVVLSAPAENKSGTGEFTHAPFSSPGRIYSRSSADSIDLEPEPRTDSCEYNSCPANSGPIGTNKTNTRLNWVNSFPVTSARYGIDIFGPLIWDGEGPELVVSGPNVGSNLWVQVPFSGTAGVAVYASHAAQIPGIAFSAASGGWLALKHISRSARSLVYAQLATQLTNAILASGKSHDVETCGGTRLPTETSVLRGGGCRIAVSVGESRYKTTAAADKQAVVLKKLGSMLTCV
ncbi:Uu.00g065850.m01.CDS01 [Anthostomella pinea]|uniref:Uu.00g065850.m01.CDS01 n=1 Tax=Anthostomella pinea TaxID=933095 RepID=A0AAI8VUH0_9PEZI|nr:Uu.00g065850.m01.CDS01 [Anthostomella pinea]